MYFNRNLLNIIKEKGLSQRHLAAAVGVTEATASNWCRDRKEKPALPSLAQVDKIAAVLDVPPAALFASSYAMRDLICEVDGNDDVARALLLLLSITKTDDGSMLSVLQDLTDIIGKLQD